MKVKSKKINGFDSKLEYEEYLKFKLMAGKGLISDLKKLEKGKDSFILAPAFKVSSTATKSKISAIQAITYTPDFFFIASGVEDIKQGRRVYVEVKSKATSKIRDYSLRKRLFLAFCVRNYFAFVEVVDNKITIFNGGLNG
jgi:hypothetical protein